LLRRALLWAERHRRWLVVVAVAVVALLAFEALRLVLSEVHLKDVRQALHAVPPSRIAAALGLTVVSYLALTGYDSVALRAIGRPLPWRVAAAGSFTSYTLSHNLGLSLLTGGSARYRVYSAAGLDLGDVAQVSAIAGITFWAGVLATAGLAMAAGGAPVDVAGWRIEGGWTRGIGVALIALVAILPLLRLTGRHAISSGGMRLPVPTLGQQAVLLGVSLVDMIAASAALFVLMPGLGPTAFPVFFIAYAVAIVVALVTHVPGGLGVFETVVLALVPGDHPAVFAGLLLYRLIYYLLPLLVAGVGIALREGWRLRHPIGRTLGIADRAGRFVAPTAVTALVFLGGFVLLVSGALPGVKGRLNPLDDLVPLPFIEGSHFAGSLVGTALLLVAPALNARLRSGFEAARVLLIGGALFSLVKGFDYEEAALQIVILGALQYAKPSFYRRGGLGSGPLDRRWLGAAAVAIALSIWAGFFAYKRVPYSDDLWWEFALHANAPRFLRASVGASVLLGAVAMWHLLTGRGIAPPAQQIDPSVASAALAEATRTDANLAFTGDKSFIVSASGDAFLMYRVQGRTWVVMGDPVGPEAAWSELVWGVRRQCDAAGGRLCFYQASQAMLPLIVELGLEAIKYGEEAQVPLERFSLAGPKSKNLRHALRRGEEAGLTFAVVPAAEVPGIMDELRSVSDAWLDDKAGAEKRFSLGPFDPAYLARFDCAVVRQGGDAGGRIVAFANLWTLPDGEELSCDLMRHLPDAPYGTMDMMFVKLFEWGRDQGYTRFDLGMAPLSGLTGGRLAPLWAKLGRALFENGERLYGFAGLRAFKAKFQPEWEPRYIATPRRLGMAHALIDLARLVSA
jgi:phosphatidylglycerol lysyltransferase